MVFFALTPDELHSMFGNKLKNMLSPDELGAFILVLANSIQDDRFRNELNVALKQNECALNNNLSGGNLRATQDDLDVFRRLDRIGTGQLDTWSKSEVGVWEVVSNPFRALRPSRSSDKEISNIHQGFNKEAFNFNKKFLQPEVLWEGKWSLPGDKLFQLKVLYNKFPFMPYHLIIVPDSDLQLPQYLTRRYHDMMWDLVQSTEQNLPGFGAGYNSLGACASVNHLHFQSFIQKKKLPIESDDWMHNGGINHYPMKCESFNEKQLAWDAINALNKNNAPYNILYRPGQCYLIPRKRQGDSTVDEAVSGAGWIEECGVFVVTDIEAVSHLTERELTDNLQSLSM